MEDSKPDIEQEQVEEALNNTENEENLEKVAILQLTQKYGVSKAQLYDRMRYLNIKTWKVSGKAYIDANQVVYMDSLHEHIKANGRMDGYPVPAPSGIVEEEANTLAVAQTQELAPPNYSATRTSSQSHQVNNTPSIVQSAQNKAAGTLYAENLLARQFIENPELLPEELQQKIRESASFPIIDPFAYAESLINSVRSEGLIK
ncbi:MAG: hypothetical protein PUP91_34360 [Rhizonema sp. PD37]|nr:hypothetical protein [Rhizonema sp. PD37]